jgi:hypothetical protein
MEGLRDRLIVRLLSAIEAFALAGLPRGPLRRRLLDHIERTLGRMHRNICGEPGKR